MEVKSPGMLGRLSEKVIGWIALAGLILGAVAVYQMPGETKGAIWSGVWRSVAWVVVAAALPWTSWLFIGRIAHAGTNWAGIALIAAFVVADIVAAMLLMTGWPPTGWAWAGGIAILTVAGSYNYLVAEYLAERSG